MQEVYTNASLVKFAKTDKATTLVSALQDINLTQSLEIVKISTSVGSFAEEFAPFMLNVKTQSVHTLANVKTATRRKRTVVKILMNVVKRLDFANKTVLTFGGLIDVHVDLVLL